MSALSQTYHSRQKVLGYPVDLLDETSALEIVEAAWRAEKGLHVVTLNAEMVVAAQQDQRLDRIIRHAHMIIPDGAGVVWAIRLTGHHVDRLPGIDLAQALLSSAAAKGIGVALLGGRQEVLASLLEVLPRLHPGLKIVAHHNGYFSSEEEAKVVEDIAQSGPQLVLLALGAPKQEYFADQWRSRLNKAVIVGVGGSFDVWTGSVKRAPESFQRLHLEWLYRLLQEPWRFKRMSSTLPKFAFQVLVDSFHNGLTRLNRKEKP
jgi:N-acetylglucosaminyldiphosphoundecaprenol N-acetyl-beta-D-mannosaminyltransferase